MWSFNFWFCASFFLLWPLYASPEVMRLTGRFISSSRAQGRVVHRPSPLARLLLPVFSAPECRCEVSWNFMKVQKFHWNFTGNFRSWNFQTLVRIQTWNLEPSLYQNSEVWKIGSSMTFHVLHHMHCNTWRQCRLRGCNQGTFAFVGHAEPQARANIAARQRLRRVGRV